MPAQSTPRRRSTGTPNIYLRHTGDYEIRYQLGDGSWRFKVLPGSADKGIRWAKKQQEEHSVKGRAGQLPKGSITFAEMCERWLELRRRDGLQPSTIELDESRVRLYLLPMLGKLKVEKIDYETVRWFLTEIAQPKDGRTLSSNTRRTIYERLRLVLDHAERAGYIASNPTNKLRRGERPKHKREVKPRMLTRQEIGRLLGATENETLRLLLLTFVCTGMRLSEALGLRWQDVDFEAGTVTVAGQLTRTREHVARTKTEGSMRTIVAPDLLMRELAKASLVADNATFVFSTRTGRPLDHGNARSAFYIAWEASGIEGPRPRFHDLRHLYISMLSGDGAQPIAAVQGQVGHGDLATTLAYTHTFEHERRKGEVRAALNGLLSAESLNIS